MKHGLAGNSALACAEDEHAKEPADKEAEIHLQKKSNRNKPVRGALI